MNLYITGMSPYVGPRTFGEMDAHRLFGRETVGRNLVRLTAVEQTVIVHGVAGSGKSSLINASVIPQLRDEERFRVLPVARVGGALPQGIDEVENTFVFSLMLSLDQLGSDPVRFAHMTLTHFLARLVTDDDGRFSFDCSDNSAPTAKHVEGYPSAPKVLIIDQIEEIFARPDLYTYREGFFEQLRDAIVQDPYLTVVFLIRSEYLAELETYARLFPARLRARQSIDRMDVATALEAIKLPAELAGRPFAPGVAEKLVDDLRRLRLPGEEGVVLGQYVEPVQLQVVCYQLWESLKVGGRQADELATGSGPMITEADLAAIGDPNQVLEDYYTDALHEVLADPAVSAAGVSELILRTWFDTKLITEGGIRGTVFRGVESTGGLTNVAVDALSKRFLLRTELRGGGAWIEMVHDRFVEPIRASNAAWFALHLSALQRQAALWDEQGRSSGLLLRSEELTRAQAWAEAHQQALAPYEKEFLVESLQARERADREAKQNKLIRILAAAAVVCAALAIVFAVFAFNAAQAASAQRNAAENQSTYEALRQVQLRAQVEAVGHDRQTIVSAFTGDLLGAALELELALEQWKKAGANREIVRLREAWLDSLRGGVNPFDSATLERLRSETY